MNKKAQGLRLFEDHIEDEVFKRPTSLVDALLAECAENQRQGRVYDPIAHQWVYENEKQARTARNLYRCSVCGTETISRFSWPCAGDGDECYLVVALDNQPNGRQAKVGDDGDGEEEKRATLDLIRRLQKMFTGAKVILCKKAPVCRVCGEPIELRLDGSLDLWTHNERCR